MKLFKIAAGMLAAGLMASSHAVTILSEGFDNVAGLAASGWVLTNASSPVGLSWFQGNSGVFPAKAGAPNSYIAANFNSTSSATGVVDNWLISPELTLGAGATLKFYTQASDEDFLDLLEVRFSSGASSAVSSFSTLVGIVGDSGDPSYPVGGWIAFTLTLPTATTGRFAFHYTVPNALNASYVGIDSLVVTAGVVPEPATMGAFALGLVAIGAVRRRSLASAQNSI